MSGSETEKLNSAGPQPSPTKIGWYECRYCNASPEFRGVMWFDGMRLMPVKDGITRVQVECCTDFIGPLVTAREPGERERAALRALVEKLDAMHEDGSWKSVWTMFSIHGGKYVGPHYDKELAAARAILTESAAPRERKRLRPQEYVVNEETIPELLAESAAPVAGGEDVERLKTSIMAIGIRLWRAARERGENASDLYELADELRALATPAEQRRE